MAFRSVISALLVCLIWTPDTARAQAVWAGEAGGGMLGVRETGILPRGSLVAGFGLDNFDRDPLGLDIAELPLRVRFGVGHNFELFGTAIVSRAVVISQDQPWPPPPADIYVLSGASAPTDPYRAVYWQLPYLGHRSSGLTDFIPGDATLGFAWRAARQKSFRPGIALIASGTVPLSRSGRNLERGSNGNRATGTAVLAVQWEIRRWSWSANAGARTATALHLDRIISDEGVTFEKLHPPVTAIWGTGLRYQAHRRLSLTAELVGLEPIGTRTATLDGTGTADFLLGAHGSWGRIGLSVGFRRHLHPPPDGSLHPTGPLANAVVLDRTDSAGTRAFLRDTGAPDIPPRTNVPVLVIGADNTVALPPGASRVPPTYSYSTTGNDGIVFALSVRIR